MKKSPRPQPITDSIIMTSVPSDDRINGIEADLRGLHDRVAWLEEQAKETTARRERHFGIRLVLLGVIGPATGAIIAYVLTKIGLF